MGTQPSGGLGIAGILSMLLGLCCGPAFAASHDATPATLQRDAEAALPNDAERARTLAQQALDDAQARGDTAAQAAALLALGRADLQHGLLPAAIVRFERALALPGLVDAPLRARLLTYLGATLDRSGLSVDAIAPQQEALKLYLDARNWLDASAVLANLGNAYASLGDTDAARTHYQRALALKREHGITRGVGSVLNNLADAAMDDGRHEDAVALLRDAIAASEAPEDAGARSTAMGNLGVALAGLGRFDDALAQATAAQAQAAALNDAGRMLGTTRSHALVLLRSAQASPQGSSARALALRDAAELLQPAIAHAREHGDVPRELQLMELMAQIREAQGNASAALALLRAERAQRAALDARTQNERRAAASARFEYAKQRGELDLLRERDAAANERLRIQRWLLIAAAAAAVGVLAAALFALRRLRERRRFDRTLEQHNRDLVAALEQANAQQRRSDAYAASHRHLLHLASEDLRTPLGDIRADAERLLADPGDADMQQHRVASIARAAADLLWVTDQMLESAREPDFAAPLSPPQPTPLNPILRDLLDEADVHALRHQQELVLDASSEIDACVHAQPLRAALRELLELVLRASPAHTRCTVRLRGDDTHARIIVDDPAGAAAGWQQKMGAPREGAHVPRLGFAWVAQSIDALGGEIGTTMHGSPPSRVIVVMLPRRGGVSAAPPTPPSAPATRA